MKTINSIDASTLAALKGNLVMTRLPNVLRRAVRCGSSAVGVACLMITTTVGAFAAGETWDTFLSCNTPPPGPYPSPLMGPNGPVRALTIFNTALIVGGQFSGVGDPANCFGPPWPQTSTYCIAGWTGSAWFPLGSGMNNSVLALTTFRNELIAGGLFTSASGVAANHIAKWNGTTWSPLGAGLNDEVYALTVFNNELYAGGRFTKSGTTTVNFIAKWNGTSWLKLGTGNKVGMSGIVNALTTFSGQLYAGGEFLKAGGTTVNRIARGNGTGTWYALGSGTSAPVNALTAFDDDSTGPNPARLYVGGAFTMAGGVAGTSCIARWSGSTWSALASGLDGEVMSLATFDDLSGSGTELYVGGYFNGANNGTTAVKIARWNGTWSAVVNGMVATPTDAVRALSPSPSGLILHAGGVCEVSPPTFDDAGYLMGYHFVP